MRGKENKNKTLISDSFGEERKRPWEFGECKFGIKPFHTHYPSD